MSNAHEGSPRTAHLPTHETAKNLGRTSLQIGVFCSASEVSPRIVEPAEEFIRLLAENGHTLAWGASDLGLMKKVASTAQAGGAKVIGVTEKKLLGKARKGIDEIFVAEDLAERKAVLFEYSDGLAVLPGGVGTFDEITEVVENKKQGRHGKPIVVLNTAGFYEGYRLQMQRMSEEGMLKHPIEHYVFFTESPQEAINYIQENAETTAKRILSQ